VPELPEVESVRRQLAPQLRGRTVVSAWWDPHPEQRFSQLELLAGRRIEAVTRRGKYLVCLLDDALELVLHLGMTGSFRFDVRDAYARALLHLDDGRDLVFRDPRRFGRMSVVEAGDYTGIPTLAALGPEPLSDDFDPATFVAGLRRTTAPVKAVLLGQRLVAGVGNIYADEALWRTRIHPASRRVGRARAGTLHAAIRAVLTEAIEREGTTFRDYRMVNGESGRNAEFLLAYGQEGRPCPRCGTALTKTVVAQRGTTYCRTCQRR
jgi:formamidopyrimidine-DNA glycosylase